MYILLVQKKTEIYFIITQIYICNLKKMDGLYKKLTESTSLAIIPQSIKAGEFTLTPLWIKVLSYAIDCFELKSQKNILKKIKKLYDIDFNLDDLLNIAKMSCSENIKQLISKKITKQNPKSPENIITFKGQFDEIYKFCKEKTVKKTKDGTYELISEIEFTSTSEKNIIDDILKKLNKDVKSIKKDNINKRLKLQIADKIHLKAHVYCAEDRLRRSICINSSDVKFNFGDSDELNVKNEIDFTEYTPIKNILNCFNGEMPDKNKFSKDEGCDLLYGDKRDKIFSAQLAQFTDSTFNKYGISAKTTTEIRLKCGCCKPTKYPICVFIDLNLVFEKDAPVLAFFPGLHMYINLGKTETDIDGMNLQFNLTYWNGCSSSNDSDVTFFTSMPTIINKQANNLDESDESSNLSDSSDDYIPPKKTAIPSPIPPKKCAKKKS
jgi:hypothetical protein